MNDSLRDSLHQQDMFEAGQYIRVLSQDGMKGRLKELNSITVFFCKFN